MYSVLYLDEESECLVNEGSSFLMFSWVQYFNNQPFSTCVPEGDITFERRQIAVLTFRMIHSSIFNEPPLLQIFSICI